MRKLWEFSRERSYAAFLVGSKVKWAGHLTRINENLCCKKISLAKPMGNRPWGRPPSRWIDCVEKRPKNFKGQKLENICQKWRCLERISGEGQGCRAIEELFFTSTMAKSSLESKQLFRLN
ncbi:hypothetical protein TNCV_2290751 [Trichonephila clavipes]|uniref:Uncharacterized protein n=1 Tax=Trichonephila clavipes TaxID=2585209 RepID=A0A8X6RNR8_TRICX|nr:hypothetical protein TNCV_2290751 [Trichonephila clavipes]